MTTAKNTTRKTALSGALVSPIHGHADGTAEPSKAWPPKNFEGFNFSASPIYALDPAASVLDVHNQLDARMTQLTSMTRILTGEGADAFHGWSAEIQDGYFWAIAMMVQECKELSGLL
jgi:hypothetical protein